MIQWLKETFRDRVMRQAARRDFGLEVLEGGRAVRVVIADRRHLIRSPSVGKILRFVNALARAADAARLSFPGLLDGGGSTTDAQIEKIRDDLLATMLQIPALPKELGADLLAAAADLSGVPEKVLLEEADLGDWLTLFDALVKVVRPQEFRDRFFGVIRAWTAAPGNGSEPRSPASAASTTSGPAMSAR